MGSTSKPQQCLRNSNLKLPKQGYGQQRQQAVEQEEDIFFVTLDLDRKVPRTLCDVGGSQTYKSNFYSEELTVQYLKRKRKSLGKTSSSFLPHKLFECVGICTREEVSTCDISQSRLGRARSSRLGAISLWSPWSWRGAVPSFLLPPTEGTAPKWGW